MGAKQNRHTSVVENRKQNQTQSIKKQLFLITKKYFCNMSALTFTGAGNFPACFVQELGSTVTRN